MYIDRDGKLRVMTEVGGDWILICTGVETYGIASSATELQEEAF